MQGLSSKQVENYKFELNFKRLRGQRRQAKDDAKKAEIARIISYRMLIQNFYARR